MDNDHECRTCRWAIYRHDEVLWGDDWFCNHPRWTEISVYPRASSVMEVCRCPMGRQRKCLVCGKMMKFHKNRPKYHGGEWRCSCE